MELTRNGYPRVVITGMAALTNVGRTQQYWESIKNGVSGVSAVPPDIFDLSKIKVHIGGRIHDFNADEFISKKEARRMARVGHFTFAVIKLLMDDLQLSEEALIRDEERTGVIMACGLGGNEVMVDAQYEFRSGIRVRPSPFVAPASLPNMPAHYVSRETKAVGPTIPVPSACAAGTHALAMSLDLIRSRKVEVVFTGGVEAALWDYTLAAFDAMTALARNYNDDPTRASRPFNRDREGFVLSEGAALFMMETLEHALARDANILAEVMGGGMSSDAFHIAAPDPEGKGPYRAMKWALEQAGLNPGDIDYINAHGTSTTENDRTETVAIKKLFGEKGTAPPISSTKSMIGHCMGAAGAIEAVACVHALQEQVMPPTINYENPDPECDLDYVPNEARDGKLQYVMSNGFGFGGKNGSIILGKI